MPGKYGAVPRTVFSSLWREAVGEVGGAVPARSAQSQSHKLGLVVSVFGTGNKKVGACICDQPLASGVSFVRTLCAPSEAAFFF